VVVGDQSSGKSSVLESLTNIPFPVAGKLCTRFATQINFRRDVVDSVRVSIMPYPGSTEAEKHSLSGFQRKVAKLDAETFKEMLSDVSFPECSNKET
jgi:GTPase SAR1 family protein